MSCKWYPHFISPYYGNHKNANTYRMRVRKAIWAIHSAPTTMADILITTFTNVFPWIKIFKFWMMNCSLKGVINNYSSLLLVMAWCWIGERRTVPYLDQWWRLSSQMHVCYQACVLSRDHFVYAPSQWETMLHYNVVSHWLGTCIERSLPSLQWCQISIKTFQLAFWLFVQLFVQANIKESIKAPQHWPFVKGIHRWPVDSPHKGPVMWKALPCHDIIMS